LNSFSGVAQRRAPRAGALQNGRQMRLFIRRACRGTGFLCGGHFGCCLLLQASAPRLVALARVRGLRAAPRVPARGRAAGVVQFYAVHRAHRQAQFAAGA